MTRCARARCSGGALLRADGVVLWLSASAGLLLSGWLRPADGPRSLGPPAAPSAADPDRVCLSYYGELVPNSAIAKVSLSWHRLHQGLLHVRDGLPAHSVLLAAALLSVVLVGRRVPRARVLVPLATSLGWTAYLALVGGDIFPGWRQLLLAFVPLWLLLADGAEEAARHLRGRADVLLVPWAVVLALHFQLGLRDPENLRAKRELWEWDDQPVGTELRQAFG